MVKVTPSALLPLAATAVASALVVAGLFVPAFTLETLFDSGDPVSILQGAWKALRDGSYFIGAVIILFSAVFPVLKLGVLTLVLLRRGDIDHGRYT